MSISAIIIDDERSGADNLRILLTKFCPEVTVKAIVNSAKEGILAIRQHLPDVIFLDINMPHLSGFDLLELMPDLKAQIVFTTAHENYALQAFKVNATDYLLKPIEIEELKQAVKRVKDRLAPKQQDESPATKDSVNNKIPINTQEGIVFIEPAELVRLMADSNYTHFFLSNGKKITVARTLKDFEEKLDASLFFRIHQKHLVNITYVVKYVRNDGGYVVLKDGTLLDVSRRKRVEFLSRFSLFNEK